MQRLLQKMLEKVKMKCIRLGCHLLFIGLCCCAEAYFAACILMRERGGGRGRREWGDCVTVLHNTMCMAFSLSLYRRQRDTQQNGEEGREGGL